MHRPWFLLLMLAAAAPAALAASPDDFCLEPLPQAPALHPETPPVRHTGRETWTVPGLDLQIDIPVEGRVRFTDPRPTAPTWPGSRPATSRSS